MALRMFLVACTVAMLGYCRTAQAQIIPKSDVYGANSISCSISAGSYTTCLAYCNDDTDVVLSGGCYTASFSQNVVMTQDYPLPSQNTSSLDEFFCEWRNNGSGSNTVHARINCVSQ